MLPWLQGRRQNNDNDGGGSTPTIIIRNAPPKVKTPQTKGQTKGIKNGK